jgi:hypothetical protein
MNSQTYHHKLLAFQVEESVDIPTGSYKMCKKMGPIFRNLTLTVLCGETLWASLSSDMSPVIVIVQYGYRSSSPLSRGKWSSQSFCGTSNQILHGNRPFKSMAFNFQLTLLFSVDYRYPRRVINPPFLLPQACTIPLSQDDA